MTEIIWGRARASNKGRVGNTGIRIERYKIKDGKGKDAWRLLLADDDYKYMHVDSTDYPTVADLEQAAIKWLIDAGRLVWIQ